MRSRGQPLAALLVIALVVVGALLFERWGPTSLPAVSGGPTESVAWFCPHGGGAGWEGELWLANPGPASVRARITAMSQDAPAKPFETVVPAGGSVRAALSAETGSAATLVEGFGGWIAAGWIVRADADGPSGQGAEPCSPVASTTWYSAGSSTIQGEHASVVVANPFEADAVFDVALFTADRPPIRDAAWTGLRLQGRHSMALSLARKAPGEGAVAVEIDVHAGRVAVGTAGSSDDGSVRSTLAQPALASVWYLPTSRGSGQAQLFVFVPTDRSVPLHATRLSTGGPASIGQPEFVQPGLSVVHYPLPVEGPTSARVEADGQGVAAALRTSGSHEDDAETGGLPAAAVSWVVLPSAMGSPVKPGLMLVNPGSVAVNVTVTILPTSGAAGGTSSIRVPPGAVTGVPASFIDRAAETAVLVRSADGPVIALGVSTSGGPDGTQWFASSAGVAVPASSA